MQGDMGDVAQLLLFPTSGFHLFISYGKNTGYFRYGNCLPGRVVFPSRMLCEVTSLRLFRLEGR